MKKYFSIIFFTVLIGVLVGGSALFSVAVREGLYFVAAPFWNARVYLSSHMEEYLALVKTKQTIANENKKLRASVEQSRLLSRERNLLAEENRELKERLGRGETPINRVLAVVLSRPDQTPYDTLIIDAGTRDGVAVGDRVAAYETVILGTILVAYESTSLVKLFSSPDEEIEITIGEEYVPAVARGIGGGNFEASLPRGLSVREGDTVSFPSISTEIAGVVEKIKVQSADAFQSILFKIPVNLYELRYVEVLVSR